MSFKKEIGQIGEDRAARFLAEQGFKIIGRNYRKPWGEIDLIAQKDKVVHFVEVKTVTRDSNRLDPEDYEPEDNLHLWKRQRLRRAIETYLSATFEKSEPDWQVDAVALYLDKEGKECFKIEWLPDVIL